MIIFSFILSLTCHFENLEALHSSPFLSTSGKVKKHINLPDTVRNLKTLAVAMDATFVAISYGGENYAILLVYNHDTGERVSE